MRKALLICLSVFITLHAWAQKDDGNSQWTYTPIKIDGIDKDWKKPFGNIDSKTKIQYSIANDDKNLYFLFEISEQIYEVKAMRAGMRVNLTGKGKSKLDASVNFPLEQFSDPVNSSRPSGDQKQRPDPKQFRDRFLISNTSMTTSGFATRNGVILVKDTSGLNAAMQFDTADVMVYELVIPLKELFGLGYTIADLSKELNMEVDINAIERPQRPTGSDTGAGDYGGIPSGVRRGGAGGGYGGGHRGGGYRGNGGGNRSELFEKTTFKHKFTLAIRKP
jgi:hypothetical protein